MESQARGGTRWRRFGLVMVPGVAATAAIGIALAQGALAASFAVSGQQFKVSVDKLDGEGFVQYGTFVTPAGGTRTPVAVSGFDHATINNLCQSVVIPVPVFGDVTVRIGAGSNPNDPVEADNLFIDLAQLNAGSATFTDINIGISADEIGVNPGGEEQGVLPGSFAQQSDGALLTDVEQVAWATSAGTFTLTDMSLGLSRGRGEECF